MKKDQIRVGGHYEARVAGRFTTVRVDAIREVAHFEQGNYGSYHTKDKTVYDVTNLKTGRKTTFRSAAKFRAEVEAKVAPDGKVHLKNSEGNFRPIGTPDPIPGQTVGVTQGITNLDLPPVTEPVIEEEDGTDPFAQSAGESGLAPDVTRTGPQEGEQCSDPTGNRCAMVADTADIAVDAAPTSVPVTMNDVPKIAAQTVTSLGIAAKIAALASPTTGVRLTDEQLDIIATAKRLQDAMRGEGIDSELRMVNGQWVLIIKAGAGTGKTFTLQQLEQVLRGSGQYTAFNRSLVDESRPKFKRATSNTSHSLAFRAVGVRYAHRLKGPRVKSYEIAARLGIEDMYLPGAAYPVDSPEWVEAADAAGYGKDNPPPTDFSPRSTRRLKAAYLAGQVTQAIKRFCQSADAELTPDHVRVDGVDTNDPTTGQRDRTNSDKVRAYLLPFAKKAWADLSSTTGTLPFAHDVYVKLWQLGDGPDRPVIGADYILLDEYQDTAPVFLDVLMRQQHALLVLVGDDNQRIYEWRGAVNAGDYFPDAPRRLLSQSFRFGQAVADVANSVLAGLEEKTDLVMRGLPTIPTRVCEVQEPRCCLYRTNAGAVGQLMRDYADGKRDYLMGGGKEVVEWCEAAVDLQNGRGTNHQELGCFQSWDEVVEYSKEEEGEDLRLMVKLVEAFGADNIRAALKGMPEESAAHRVLSTAHKSKGREWTSVKLGQDFPLPNKMSDADRRLMYVAATRAQEELDVSECPTFMGGWDKQGGGEGGDGGVPAEWVPGITVKYTAPMPTPETLAEYRAGKAATAPVAPVAAASGDTPGRPVQGPANGVPAAAPASGTGNPAAGGNFTWANLDGAWCARGDAGYAGKLVTIVRRDGSTKKVTLVKVVKVIGELTFYEIR